MLDAENIFLVGPMGSGKSAVGRQLAVRLGLKFVDSDAAIEARTGVDIPYIFEREGEAARGSATSSTSCRPPPASSWLPAVAPCSMRIRVPDCAGGAASCIFGPPWTSNLHAPGAAPIARS